MTTVSYVGGGTRAVSINGNVTPTIPAGVADGDLLIAWATIASPTRTYLTAPSGWTALTSITSSATNGPGLYVYWKRYSTGDADPLFSGTGSDAGAGVVAKCIAYRNADVTTGPVAGTTYNTGATTGSNAGPISGVAVSGDGRALILAAWANGYTTAPATPSGWTNVLNDKSAGTNPVSYASDDISVNGATSASVTITATPTAAASRVGVQIAIPEGAQNYTGTLAVTSTGTLSLGASSMSASGSLAVSSTGTLSLGGKPGDVGSLAITSTGTLSLGGTPAAKNTLAITSTGTLSLFAGNAQGTLAITSTGTLALAPSSMTAKGALSITSTGTLSLGGKPITKGILVLTGVGLLTLSALITTRLKWWDGAAWQPTVIRYWDGAAWQLATLRVWDGAVWA